MHGRRRTLEFASGPGCFERSAIVVAPVLSRLCNSSQPTPYRNANAASCNSLVPV